MPKLRVLFLIESFIVGGAEKVLVDIVNHLNSEKFDITVCSVFKKSVYDGYENYFEKPFNSNIHYRYLVNNENRWLYKAFNFLLARIPSVLYRLFIGDRYDRVVAFYEGLPTYWIANAKLRRGEKIAWLHTSTELSQRRKSSEKLKTENAYYKQFKKIIAISKIVASSFSDVFPNVKSNLTIAYNPIDSEVIFKKSLSTIERKKPEETLFVCVGRMTEVKGYSRLLTVLSQLKQMRYNFKFWIIGGGNSNELRDIAEKQGLKNDVLFLGHKDNPYPYMAKADWFLSSSYVEGFGMAILEAMILGKPVIATNSFGSKEILGNSEYGILTENTEEGLYDGIKRVLDNPNLLKKYALRSIQRRKDFSLEASMKQIESIL